MTQVRRLGSVTSALALFAATAASTVLLIASPANAQAAIIDDSVGPVEEVGDAVGDATAGIGSNVGEAVKDTGSEAGDAVADVGASVGDAVGGPAGDAVTDTAKTGGGSVKDTTGKIGDAITKTGGSTGDTIKETAGTVGKTADGLLEESNPDGGSIGPDLLGGTPGVHKGSNSPTDSVLAEGRLRGSSGNFALANSIQGLEFADRAGFVDAVDDGRSPLGLGRFVQEAIDAAKQFVFPLALTLMVVAYMVVQGRIDSRDPKLAVAAVDAEQDLLNFS